MQRTGQTFPFSGLLLILFLLAVYSCANESNQNSSPRQGSVEQNSNNSDSNEGTKTSNEDETGAKEYENPLDNRENSSAKQARLEREAQTCIDEDLIKNVEVIVTGEALEAIDITNQYKSGTLFEDATKLGKRVEPEIDPNSAPDTPPSPPKEESTTEEAVKVTLYKRPEPFAEVQTVIPAPVFKFSLTGASTDTGIKVDLDESLYPLLNGFSKKVEISYDKGNLNISDLAKVIISRKKHIFQVSTPFTTPPGQDPLVQIKEINLRQILKVTLRINGKKIYETDEPDHVIALHAGEDQKLSYKPEWADLNIEKNKLFQQYLEKFNECTAALPN
ncbi:MAG: hypothetical protein AB8G05_05365 [Oligoflexales bacterium]